jgi:hypothetical protein
MPIPATSTISSRTGLLKVYASLLLTDTTAPRRTPPADSLVRS